VRHPEGLDLEDRGGVERLAGEDLPEVGPDVHFIEPLGDKRQGEAGAVDGDGTLAEEEGERADVVLVGVGEQHRAELGGGVPEVAEVRNDQLHPRELGRRKEQARVDEEQLVPALEDHRVQADLTESAEGDDAQHVFGQYANDSFTATAPKPSRLAPPGTKSRFPTTAAPMPCRAVFIGVSVRHRSSPGE